MFQSGYYVTAELRLKDVDRLASARQELQQLAQQTLDEAGCSVFTVHHDPAEPTRFLLWERFDDEAAFRQHFEQPHTKAYLAQDLTEIVQRFVTNVI